MFALVERTFDYELQKRSDGSRVALIGGLMDAFHVSFSPDERWLVMKGRTGMRIFELPTAKLLWDHDYDSDFNGAYSRVKWNSDGRLGAVAGGHWVYVWSMAEPRWVARLQHCRSGVWTDVALSADGEQLAASASDSRTVAYWPHFGDSVREYSKKR
jgi:WD40 repeat protein